jgi:ubiquitin carboxyl-terminal hydrolase 4/11/15
MKENNTEDSSIEIINNTNEKKNLIKESDNLNNNQENNKSTENSETQPLKDSEEPKNRNAENNIEKKDEKNNINIIQKKSERISLDILFKKKLHFESNCNKGRTGLVNIGNTCFMNSALQCLSNCYELTKYFLLNFYENDINQENRLGTGGQVVTIYRKLLDDLWLGDDDYINPNYFKRIFAHFVHKFSGYAQQDSNEFLIYLLDKIHEDLNTITVKPYIEMEGKKPEQTDEEVSKIWWEKHLKRENSIIVDLFHGQFKSTISCNICHEVCVSFDSYMFISLPIPSGKYEIEVKYFGYNINDFLVMKIPITENTTVLNIIDIMKNRINIINSNKNKNIKNNPPKRKKRNKNKNKIIKKLYEQINLSKDKIEMVLLTNKKKIYKVFTNNDYIFPYLLQGYELVAYEKDTSNQNNENIYFYLSQYYYSYIFSLFYYPRIYFFDYPFAINFDKTQKIFNIYKNIKEFLKELLPNNNPNNPIKKDEILNIDFNFNKINKDNEKSCGFTLYLNTFIPNTNSSLCSYIFSFGNSINHPLLEKYSSTENYSNIKRQLNLDELHLRLTLDVDILFNLDKARLPKLKNYLYNKKLSLNVGKDINLYDCLNLFNSEEILDGDNEWYCNKCKKHVDAVKKMDVYKSPYYLIFQLKRFKQDNEGSSIFNIFNSSKNTTFIDFPVTNLDLSNYILSENNQGGIYDLIGVINHYGGESFGHYTAYCLNGKKWMEYNDEYVAEIKKGNIITNAAYVLFYRRRDEN